MALAATSATPAAGARAGAGAKFAPAGAARACVHGRALGSQLGTGDASFLARFIPCLLRHYRAQAGLSYVQNRALSRTLAATLTRLVKLPYLAENRGGEANAVGMADAGAVARRFCKSRGWPNALFQFLWADTSPPPVPTPLEFARLLGSWFKYKVGVARTPPALFGVATTRGVLFRADDLAGAASGAVGVVCA